MRVSIPVLQALEEHEMMMMAFVAMARSRRADCCGGSSPRPAWAADRLLWRGGRANRLWYTRLFSWLGEGVLREAGDCVRCYCSGCLLVCSSDIGEYLAVNLEAGRVCTATLHYCTPQHRSLALVLATVTIMQYCHASYPASPASHLLILILVVLSDPFPAPPAGNGRCLSARFGSPSP